MLFIVVLQVLETGQGLRLARFVVDLPRHFRLICSFLTSKWPQTGKSCEFMWILKTKSRARSDPGSLFTITDLRFNIQQPMNNEEIARQFNRMASLMEIRGEDTFRIRSYRMAAEAIETWPTPMKEIAKQEGAAGLQEIPGVGKATAGKILELIERGSFDAWDKLTAETPETILDLLELPGIGPKTAATFHQKFKVSSLDDLRKFVAGGGLETVDGIGPKTVGRIKRNLERLGVD